MVKRVVTIVGPTASGKTKLSIILAKKLNSEIISADSRQTYKELNIGTAKPTEEELKQIKHHFINHLSIKDKYDAGKFFQDAQKVINQLFQLNKIPIIVGGSGLYINSLLYGIFEGPSADDSIRLQLEGELKSRGKEYLLEVLKKFDVETYNRIDKNNPRRIIRALEVYYLTGIPLSQLQKEKHIRPEYENFIFGLNWNRKILYQRINDRVDKMISEGLVDEVKFIIDNFGENVNVVLQTVGYKEVIQYLKNEITYDKMIELIKRNTRRYAKRQLTWFRKDKNIRWIEVNSEDQFELISEHIIKQLMEGDNERKN